MTNWLPLPDLKGADKLRACIAAARAGEPMSKGMKTAYYTAAKLNDEFIEKYIDITIADEEKPNVKGLITCYKAQYIQRGYHTELFPTPEQKELLFKYVDGFRWTYNELYAQRRKAIVAWHYINSLYCRSAAEPNTPKLKPFNWKAEYETVSQKSGKQPDWVKGISSLVINTCVRSFPKKPSGFRSKSKSKAEFAIDQGDQIKVGLDFITIPGIGNIGHARPGYIPQNIKVAILGVSYLNGRWYAGISANLDKKKPELRTEGKTKGADPGLRTRITTFDGELGKYDNTRSTQNKERLTRLEKQLKQWQRTADRRYQKGAEKQSNRYQFAQNQVRAIHRKLACLRKDDTHQITHRVLAKDVKQFVFEDTNVKGLQGTIWKGTIGEMKRQLKYKSEWCGIEFIMPDQFFPSSKLCSNCLTHNAKLGSEEYWTCSNCGVRHHRDENSARNFQQYPELEKAFPDIMSEGRYKDLAAAKRQKDLADRTAKRPAGLPESEGQASTVGSRLGCLLIDGAGRQEGGVVPPDNSLLPRAARAARR
jgi:putative transposase